MAEDLLPTIVPGMVGLKDKKSGRVTQHFPVDAREILTTSKDYELVENGAFEAARMNATPLKNIAAGTAVTEVAGIEGQIMVAMSPEQADAWKKSQAATAGKEVPEAPKADAKPEAKPASK